VKFWLIFAQIWLPWQLPQLLWKFEFTKPIKTLLNMRKIPRFLARNGNLCNFGLFFSKFGCHSNSLSSLKNWYNIFEVADPKTWLFMKKSPRFLAPNWNQCNFGLFLFKFGCHGNSLGSLKNSDSILKFTSPEIPTEHAKNYFSISCRELMSAIFAQIWLPWQPPWLP